MTGLMPPPPTLEDLSSKRGGGQSSEKEPGSQMKILDREVGPCIAVSFTISFLHQEL